MTGGGCLVTVRPQGGNHLNLESLQILIRLATASLAAALALVLVWRTLNRGRVGTVRWRVRRRHSVRVVLVLGTLLVATGVVAGSQIGRSADTLLLLALSVALIALCPGFQDSVYGERGVQRGWYARRLGELEAWRLIGEHLRWKLFGEWVATDVPASDHAALRARLEALAPGRESAHGNAGFDPVRAAATKSNS